MIVETTAGELRARHRQSDRVVEPQIGAKVVQIDEARRRVDGGEAAREEQQVGRHAARVIVSDDEGADINVRKVEASEKRGK